MGGIAFEYRPFRRWKSATLQTSVAEREEQGAYACKTLCAVAVRKVENAHGKWQRTGEVVRVRGGVRYEGARRLLLFVHSISVRMVNTSGKLKMSFFRNSG